ncbi:AtpZ/AtpI family protein [Alkalibacter rhizosphaerae]|uniref:AtpZ/AtpI family protein n=1 Tax=Alkalibacter rhizosphaerae TaxID=2815577 RepID=A0A974XG96_9FIRM|nr:AtpZ/AtpI family protein [Alkalibacter rhizosphaerae]QSX09314.1 AtpZ/AtpI family protein [Alkalibacter rhizosphaerae]
MNKNNPWMNLALITQLGISMFIPIAGCFFLGRYLDARFETAPLFLFILTIMGVLAAFRNLFVLGTRAAQNKSKERDHDTNDE